MRILISPGRQLLPLGRCSSYTVSSLFSSALEKGGAEILCVNRAQRLKLYHQQEDIKCCFVSCKMVRPSFSGTANLNTGILVMTCTLVFRLPDPKNT